MFLFNKRFEKNNVKKKPFVIYYVMIISTFLIS